MTSIVLDNVTIDFPVPSLRSQSLKTVLLGRARAVGGNIVDAGTSIACVRALDGVSFSLKDGDSVGLIGPNGAGKTTLLRALSGIYMPTDGLIDITGTQVPMFDISIGFDHEATGYENIYLRGLIMGLTEKEIEVRIEDVAEFSELGAYLEMPIRAYSTGMTLRLMFAIATSVRGNIVLMDEWISVGDQNFKDKANTRLMELTDEAGILVIASHEPGVLTGLCNLGLYLDGGKVVRFGPIEEVLDLYQSHAIGDSAALEEAAG